MADINIAGIMRAGAYSPNHIGNDTAIFNAVAEQLRKRGCIVNTYSEEQFNNSDMYICMYSYERPVGIEASKLRYNEHLDSMNAISPMYLDFDMDAEKEASESPRNTEDEYHYGFVSSCDLFP